MPFNNVLVFGAGAIGSFYGAFLSEKFKVTLIGSKEHVEKINQAGLKLSGEVKKTYSVKALTELADIPEKTLVLLTVKTYDLEKALKQIKPHLKKDSVILLLQNGYGNKAFVKKLLPETTFVRGITSIGATYKAPGEIIANIAGGSTKLEPSPYSQKINEMFNACHLNSSIPENFKKEIWRKMIVNCTLNPLTALLQVQNREIFVPELQQIINSIILECLAVAQADGVFFEEKPMELIGPMLVRSKNYSSMYQDLKFKRPTEIDFLNGKIVELGKKYNITVPVNEILVSLIKFREKMVSE